MEVLRKYGVATTILFPLIDAGANDFEATPVTFAAGDTQISKDEGAFANTGSNPAHEGNGVYSLALTATEMQAARIAVTIVDSATKTWEDQAVIISTYGNASGQHAFDLDTATQNVTVTTNSDKSGYSISGTKTTLDALNDVSAADVNAQCDTALSDYDAPTKAELDSGFAGLNDPTAAAVADAVWDEATTGHTTAGTFGEQLKTDVDAILVDTAATIPGQITGLNDLSAAQVNAEVDTALADYDPPTKAELDAGFAALNDPTAAAVASAVVGTVVENSLDISEVLRLILSACAGKSSGHESGSPLYRDTADSKNRISATTDANGNRTAVTLDAS